MRHLIYLHGFASSAKSTKATAFAARAAEAGWSFACPDLNLPDFESLTISRMIDQVSAAVAASPAPRVALVGSSLGALVALEAAVQPQPQSGPQIDALVFLAPALDLVPGMERHLGPAAVEQWQRTGALDVFHFGDQRVRSLKWAFLEDARRYDPMRTVTTLPVLVYQGRRDDVVDVLSVTEWTARPTARHPACRRGWPSAPHESGSDVDGDSHVPHRGSVRRQSLLVLTICLFAVSMTAPAAAQGQSAARVVAWRLIDVASSQIVDGASPALIDTPSMPGSIANLPTLVAALESGAITPATHIACPGFAEVDGRRIACLHPGSGGP